MPDFSNQDPRWPDKSHFEPTCIRFKGAKNEKECARCQCWTSDRSGQCKNPAATGLTMCDRHGALGIKSNKRIQTRKEFQSALSDHTGEDGETQINSELIAKLAGLCKSGSLDAIKYWFDQQFGSPKTTIVQQVDASIMVALGEVLGEFVDAHRLDECLLRIHEAITESS